VDEDSRFTMIAPYNDRFIKYWFASTISFFAVVVALLAIGNHLGTFSVRYFLIPMILASISNQAAGSPKEALYYDDVFSEYPLFANGIFAAIRYITESIFPLSLGFQYLWILMAGAIWVLATFRVAAVASLLVTVIWLAPGSIYFALFRYDIYPTVATLFGLFAIRRESYIAGAIWFGVAIALMSGISACETDLAA
jgi:hypothetical protein